MKTSSCLNDCYQNLSEGAKVLDVGCLDFVQMELGEQLRPGQLRHFGIDYAEPAKIPPHFTFKKVDLNASSIPFEEDSFDLVVAKHIIEHLKEPLIFFQDCLRVCKPGGILYLEAPSERSLLLPGMPFEHEKFFSLSFYDDPTHMSRPWSPQSLHRLTKLYSCEPIKADYLTSFKRRISFPIALLIALFTKNGGLLERTVGRTIGWASYLIAKKPETIKGAPPFHYYVPPR